MNAKRSFWPLDRKGRCSPNIVDGLEKAPEAFIGMLKGQNFGKLIIRVGDRKQDPSRLNDGSRSDITTN